jgi:hypothetical protein
LDGENPTAGDSGASITDRLERMLTAESAPAEKTAEVTADKPEPTQAVEQVEPENGDQQQEPEPQTVSTADVAKYLGVDESMLDVDEDGTIKVRTKIDGKDGAAKFSDLLKDYQLRGHAENKAREVAEREKAIQARAQEVEQHAQAKLQQVEHLTKIAAGQLMREYQGINWEALRQQDPGQYAALRADFQERNTQLQAALQSVGYQQQQQAQQAEGQRRAFLAEQAEKLPELIPEWKDQAIAQKERGEIRDWALKAGFQAAEVDNLTHAHHVAVMRKAMQYDKLQQSKPAIENKVRTAPKLVKPGQSQEVDSKTQNLRNLKTQIKASGGKRGIADWLLASGKV